MAISREERHLVPVNTVQVGVMARQYYYNSCNDNFHYNVQYVLCVYKLMEGPRGMTMDIGVRTLRRRMVRVETVRQPLLGLRQSLAPPPQGLHLSLELLLEDTIAKPTSINEEQDIPSLGEGVGVTP